MSGVILRFVVSFLVSFLGIVLSGLSLCLLWDGAGVGGERGGEEGEYWRVGKGGGACGYEGSLNPS